MKTMWRALILLVLLGTVPAMSDNTYRVDRSGAVARMSRHASYIVGEWVIKHVQPDFCTTTKVERISVVVEKIERVPNTESRWAAVCRAEVVFSLAAGGQTTKVLVCDVTMEASGGDTVTVRE